MSNNINVMNKNKELKINLTTVHVTISEIPRSIRLIFRLGTDQINEYKQVSSVFCDSILQTYLLCFYMTTTQILSTTKTIDVGKPDS